MLRSSILQQRSNLPPIMKCFQLESYNSSVNELSGSFKAACPSEKDLKPDQAIIKIHAASINPFDIEMSRGYGRNAINVLRKYSNISEFPLILGRDCSGTIVKRGKRFRRAKEGQEVCCVRWVVGSGTHAEYVVVNKSEVSVKPPALNHIEAASIPYVACTSWSTLINSGAVTVNGRRKQRIFIPGGTGGIGSFATQLCQAYGHDVITSCSTDGIEELSKLNIKNVLDYKSETFTRDLQNSGPFDVILDTLNEQYIELFRSTLKRCPTSKYISLRPALLPDTDQQGLALGLLNSSAKLFNSSITQFISGKGTYQWGFFTPNALILDRIRPLIEEGKIVPYLDKVFDIDDIVEAYKYIEKGHARGKTVIKMK